MGVHSAAEPTHPPVDIAEDTTEGGILTHFTNKYVLFRNQYSTQNIYFYVVILATTFISTALVECFFQFFRIVKAVSLKLILKYCSSLL